jgi:hypothetical protein
LASTVDTSLSSRNGLATIVTAAQRLPGGIQQTRNRLADWHSCSRFISNDLEEVSALWRLVLEAGGSLPEGVLARDREKLLLQFGEARRVVFDVRELKAAAAQWLDSYRRHYLAWHERAHALSQFAALSELRQSPTFETARRLAQAGLGREDMAQIQAELAKALAGRCLAGDPLPPGHTVCPVCRVALGDEMERPEAEALQKRVDGVMRRQLAGLREQGEMLRRRLAACDSERIRSGVQSLLNTEGTEAETLTKLLCDEVIAWLREHLAQPKAHRRELEELVARLKGKELTKQEVLRIVTEWLGEEDGFVEVV